MSGLPPFFGGRFNNRDTSRTETQTQHQGYFKFCTNHRKKTSG